jgi:hypothetical protein
MEDENPWGDIPEKTQPNSEEMASPTPQSISITDGFGPMNQGPMLTGTTQMPTGQLIYLQPPSSAAKVVGILVVIYGFIFGILFNILALVSNAGVSSVLVAFDVGNIAAGVAMVVGGVMMINYQRRGVMLLLCAIVLTALIGVGQLSMVEGMYDQLLQDGEITQEEYDALQDVGGIVQGVGIVMVAFCNALCGLIVAIPLMVSNNGLDESKLFG